jgi:hypothetical protein
MRRVSASNERTVKGRRTPAKFRHESYRFYEDLWRTARFPRFNGHTSVAQILTNRSSDGERDSCWFTRLNSRSACSRAGSILRFVNFFGVMAHRYAPTM